MLDVDKLEEFYYIGEMFRGIEGGNGNETDASESESRL
jgi:hypothetical protein